MNKIKNWLIIFSGLTLGLFSVAPMTPAYAAVKDDIQQGACGAAGQRPCDSATATSSLNQTIENVINILSIVVGIIAVIMIIFAGFRYITSAGNDQTIAAAKRTLIYALIGLVLVALAQVIVRFVLRNVTTNTP